MTRITTEKDSSTLIPFQKLIKVVQNNKSHLIPFTYLSNYKSQRNFFTIFKYWLVSFLNVKRLIYNINVWQIFGI